MDQQSSLDIKISGKVQGVGFRYSTINKARELNLTGWVKNQPDGSVEIRAEGQQKDLDLLVEWCYHGPGSARVERVKVNQVPAENFSSFSLR
ncbi:MAG: acylphosphatase [Candidatus Cyclobacteriaceae bacterium M3_2C_046]